MSQEPLASPSPKATPALHQVVHSPERYRLDLPLAGPTSRILAYAIDFVAIFGLQILAILALAMLFPLAGYVTGMLDELRGAIDGSDPNALTESSSILVIFGFLVIVQLVIEWGYFIVSEMTTGGRSLGKAIVKLRVVGDGGHPLRLGQSVARNLLRAVDILPGYYVVGLTAMIASDQAKRLGDLAAGTAVIRLDRPAPAPAISFESTPGSAAFRFSHEQIERVGRDEQRLMRQTLRRVPNLSRELADIALERAVAAIVARIEHDPVDSAEQEDFLRALLHEADRR